MAVRRILQYPHPNLRKKCGVVEEFSHDLRNFADDLLETMYASNGIGLSAPQVNMLQRIIAVDASPNKQEPLVLINPVVTDARNPTVFEEGCLSFPGFYEKVKRPLEVEVSAFDVAGKPINIEAEGIKAICIQHECDHLDGKLFVDYLSKLKASRIHKKMLQGKKP